MGDHQYSPTHISAAVNFTGIFVLIEKSFPPPSDGWVRKAAGFPCRFSP
jgi:hypothetical protein